MATVNIELPSGITIENTAGGCSLLRGIHRKPFREMSWGALSIPGLSRYLALSLHTHFVTSPAFGADLSQVRDRTQFLLWEERGLFGVLLPLLHEDFRAEISGLEGGLQLKCTCSPAGRSRDDVVLALVCVRPDPYQAVQDGIRQAVQWMGRGRTRTEKTTPDWINHLGWCTWDAFYADVTEEKILEGLCRFQEGGILPGHMIIDEGWQDYSSKNFLLSYGVKKGAFTGDSLKTVILRAKNEFGLKLVGCWRTLFGELRGVDVESTGFGTLKRRAVPEPGTQGDIFGVVEPCDVPRFHEEYAARMASDGVDFVKIDFQSALHQMTYGQTGRAEGARIWQYSVQDSVEKHFRGGMLNCMSMGTDEVYHTRTSNVCRSSDDFFPTKDDSHAAHVRQNAYNSLWLSHLEWPDWDMFQSEHPWALYHAMARAISGGPVYVSDKPGKSDYALLKRLVAADGKLLRCPHPALPVREILFEDPTAMKGLLKVFNRCGHIGLLGVFHPLADPGSGRIGGMVAAREVEGLNEARFAAYSLKRGFLGVVELRENLGVDLEPAGSDLIIFSPLMDDCAVLGLVDKLNPAAAILDQKWEDGQVVWAIRGGGRLAFYSDRPVDKINLDGEPVPLLSEGGLYTVDTGVRHRCRVQVRCSA